jgi:hypothetical protein
VRAAEEGEEILGGVERDASLNSHFLKYRATRRARAEKHVHLVLPSHLTSTL